MLDLHNLFAFHHCPEAMADGVYRTTGEICLDEAGRPMIYPPPLFYSFAWMRLIESYHTVTGIWAVSMVAFTLGVGFFWIAMSMRTNVAHRSASHTGTLVVLWLLLMLQFPFVFALERGNNDVLPLILWTWSALALSTDRPGLAGLTAGAAAAMKVYPLTAIAVVGLGLIRRNPPRHVALYCAGGFAGMSALVLAFPTDSLDFVNVALPSLVRDQYLPLTIYSHSLWSLPGGQLVGVPVGLWLLATWAWASLRSTGDTALGVVAGALAISTYFSRIGWDYSLITAMPLMLLTVEQALRSSSRPAWSSAALALVFAVFSGRYMLSPVGSVLLGATAMGAVGVLYGLEGDSPPPGVRGS